jgi:hypothetical protein
MGIETEKTSEGQVTYAADFLQELEIFRDFMYSVTMGGIVIISTGLAQGLVTAVVRCAMTNCKKDWLSQARTRMINPGDIELAINQTTQTIATDTDE